MATTSITKSIAKNFSWLVVGSVVSGGLNFLSVVYVARILDAASFGLWQFVQAFLVYLVLAVDSGLSVFGTREIAKDHSRATSISINIFFLRGVLAVLVFCCSLLALYLFPLSTQLRLLFMLTFLLVFYRAFNADWVFQGLEKMEYIAFSKVSYAVLYFTLLLLLVRNSNNLLRVPLVQLVVGLLVSFGFLVVLFKMFPLTRLEILRPRHWIGYFWQAVPLGAALVLIQVYNNLDTIMLGLMDKVISIAYYSAAYQIFFVLVGFFVLWQSTALPVASRLMKAGAAAAEAFLKKYLRLTALAVIPVVFLGFLLAPFVVGMIFGGGYKPSILAFQVLVWAFIPLALGSTYGVLVLIPAGMFRRFFVAVAMGAAVNVGLNLLLIPSLSFCGAAIATIAAELCAGSLAFFFSRRVLHLGLLEASFKPILFSLVAMFLAWCFLGEGLWWQSVFAGSIFFLVYTLLTVVWEREFIFAFVNEILGKNP